MNPSHSTTRAVLVCLDRLFVELCYCVSLESPSRALFHIVLIMGYTLILHSLDDLSHYYHAIHQTFIHDCSRIERLADGRTSTSARSSKRILSRHESVKVLHNFIVRCETKSVHTLLEFVSSPTALDDVAIQIFPRLLLGCIIRGRHLNATYWVAIMINSSRSETGAKLLCLALRHRYHSVGEIGRFLVYHASQVRYRRANQKGQSGQDHDQRGAQIHT